MDFFQTLPSLRRHSLLKGKMIATIGVSAIPYDDAACYFEIAKPKYWRRREGDEGEFTRVGVGGIGGGIKRGENVLACLRREVKEELGVRVQPEMSPRTFLLDDWQLADTLRLEPSKKRPSPLMVILTPPRLGGPGTPDHLAIIAFSARLRGAPTPHDLFGLLRIENSARQEFFARDEWPLDDVHAHPGLTVTLNGQPPSNPILHPLLTARAFQILVRGGYV